MDLCPDASCAAMGNMHKMGCKGKELEAQRQQGREFAKCKDFDKLLGANRAQAQALRIGFKQAAKAKSMNFCKNFNSKAVPCQDECMAYPCCEWPEIMETELDGTFYTELEPEMLREENPNLLILYLRNIPTVADVPAYQQQVAAHYKLADDKGKGRPVRTEILRTEICGEKTENRDDNAVE